MIHGQWESFLKQLAERITAEGEVTLSIEEVIAATGTTDRSIRGRSFWHAAQRGAEFADAFSKAQIEFDFSPNEIGAEVESVTFRKQPPTVSF